MRLEGPLIAIESSDSEWSPGTSRASAPARERGALELGRRRDKVIPPDMMREAMRSLDDGVNVADRKLMLRTVTQCFSASDAVAWLVERYSLSHSKASEFCQSLLDDNDITCVSGATRFVDSDDEFFRWAASSGSLSERSSAGRRAPLRPKARIRHTDSGDLSPLSSLPLTSSPLKRRGPQQAAFGREMDKSWAPRDPQFLCSHGQLHLLKKLVLSSSRWMRSVTLTELELTAEVFSVMMDPLKQMEVLEQLSISDTPLGSDALLKLLDSAAFAPSLRELRLQNVGLNDADATMEQLWELLLSKLFISKLDMSRNIDLADRSVALLSRHLTAVCSLNRLILDETGISIRGQILLFQTILWAPNLSDLSLANLRPQVKSFTKQFAGSISASFSKNSSEKISQLQSALKSSQDMPKNESAAKVVLKSSQDMSKNESAAKVVRLLLLNLSLRSLILDSTILPDNVVNISRMLLQNGGIDSACISLSQRGWTFVPSQLFSHQLVTELCLSHNQLRGMPWSILRMQFLESLDLSHNDIGVDEFPIHLSHLPRLRHLDVSNNPVVEQLPAEVNWRKTNDLLKHFHSSSSGTFTWPVCKVMVLGDPGTGRSVVAQKVSGLSEPSDRRLSLDLYVATIDPRISLTVWDFASTVVSRPTILYFILPDALFVIVFSLADASSIRRIDYWMEILSAKAPGANIIIVATHADGRSDQDTVVATLRSRIRLRYTTLVLHSVIAIDARSTSAESFGTWTSLRKLMTAISIQTEPLRNWVGKSFPRRFLHFRGLLRAERQLLDVPMISVTALRAMSRVSKIKGSDIDLCFLWLQYSGEVMFFDNVPRLKDMVILDPFWLMTAMDSVASCEKAIISPKELSAQAFALPKYSSTSVASIFKLLEAFSVLEVFLNSESEPKFVVPFLLSEMEPALSSEDQSIIMMHQGHTYQRVYEVSALVFGLFDQLLINLMHITSRHCSVWRKGFVFMQENLPDGTWDVISCRVVESEELASKPLTRIFMNMTTMDRSGRILHVVATAIESLVRGWFPGSHFKRLVLTQTDELDLDVLSDELMQLSSASDLRTFSNSALKGYRDEIPDVLLSHTRRVQWRDLRDIKEIGSGSYGKVYQASYRDHSVAVKQVRSAEILCLTRPQAFALFLQECWAMNFLNHPKIITLVGVCFQPMSMVLEFMELGDLRYFLDSELDVPWPVRVHLLSDVAEGMNYAHSQWPPIIHKDLKSPNVFLTRENGRVIAKVADLGLAEVLPKTSKVQGVDNPIWAAVELIEGGLCTEKVDVWSFAIMMWEILYPSKFPYNDSLERLGWMSLLSDSIKSDGLRPTISNSDPEVGQSPRGFVSLMKSCWQTAPAARPTFTEVALRMRQFLIHLEETVTVENLCLENVCSFGVRGSCSSSGVSPTAIWLARNGNSVQIIDLVTGGVDSVLRLVRPIEDCVDDRLCVTAEGTWLCNGSDSCQWIESGSSRTSVLLKGALDSIWEVVLADDDCYFAVGTLRGKFALGEWSEIEKSAAAPFAMTRLVVVPHHEILPGELRGSISIQEQSQLWLFTAKSILLVDLVQMAPVSSLVIEARYGELISLFDVVAAKQVWGLTRSATKCHFLVWNYNEVFITAIEISISVLSALYVAKWNVFCLADHSSVTLYDADSLAKAFDQVPSIAKTIVHGFSLASKLDVEKILRDEEAFGELLKFSEQRKQQHYVQFLRLMDQLHVSWDAAVAQKVESQYLSANAASSVLSVSSVKNLSSNPFSRQQCKLIEEDVKEWLRNTLFAEFARKDDTESSCTLHWVEPLSLIVLVDHGRAHVVQLAPSPSFQTLKREEGTRLQSVLEKKLAKTAASNNELIAYRLTLLMDQVPLSNPEPPPRARALALIQPRRRVNTHSQIEFPATK